MTIDDNPAGDALSLFQSLREKLQAIQVPHEEHPERRTDEPRPDGSGAPRVGAPQVAPDTNSPAPDDPGQLLAIDPRTRWAWSEYKKNSHALPVSRQDAQQVLSAIPPGDHVEIFGAVTITSYYLSRDRNALPSEARFAARTFHCWILPTSGFEPETIPASSTKWYCHMGGSIVDPVAESHFSLPDNLHFYAFADNRSYKRYDDGAGREILRLPDNPLAPEPPEIGKARTLVSAESPAPVRLVGDWRTAEDLAFWHMTGPLGFFGSRLTGGVSDRGIDVEHPDAVAQVKMQANPVGSPLIRQLRGARPDLKDHVFYSTSGYTTAAIAEASETGVALFILDSDAGVHPIGACAARLILDGYSRHGGDDALVADYIRCVSKRVRRTHANYESMDTGKWLSQQSGKVQRRRAEDYLEAALQEVKRHPRLGVHTHKEIISHFRNADLKAAFFCRVLGLPYPLEEPLVRRSKPSTAADFY